MRQKIILNKKIKKKPRNRILRVTNVVVITITRKVGPQINLNYSKPNMILARVSLWD